MFSRVVAVRTKPGKVRALAKTIHEKILPILEDQPGFVDEILLVSDTEPDQILSLSFWESQQDAERRTITRTKRSHGKGFDLPVDLIRKQLKVTGKEMAGLVQCSLGLSDYIAILRAKKLL